MEPILAVWDGRSSSALTVAVFRGIDVKQSGLGYSLNGAALAEGQLDPYIQQAIDQVGASYFQFSHKVLTAMQINFAIGDPTTSAPAALRSSLGHPEPFVINHIEIGNEVRTLAPSHYCIIDGLTRTQDFISSTASSTYASYRWPDFHGNLSAAFPQLRKILLPNGFNRFSSRYFGHIGFLATSTVNSPALTPKPQEWDVHVYQTPSKLAYCSNIHTFHSLMKVCGCKVGSPPIRSYTTLSPGMGLCTLR